MEDRTVIEWDKDDIDALGILKVDVLGLGMLTCIRRGFDLLRRHRRRRARPGHACPRTTPAIYDMLCRADTPGRLPDREPGADEHAAAAAAASASTTW